MAVRALLRWLRIEDAAGSLSLTTVMLAAGAAFGRTAFAMTLAAWALEKVLTHRHEAAAMRGANEVILARRTADADAQAARLVEMEKLLKEALTPERLELSRAMMKAKMAGVLRGA